MQKVRASVVEIKELVIVNVVVLKIPDFRYPPAPRRFLKKLFCKDAGASSGTYTREYACYKCAKPFGNYKCSRCDCIYC